MNDPILPGPSDEATARSILHEQAVILAGRRRNKNPEPEDEADARQLLRNWYDRAMEEDLPVIRKIGLVVWMSTYMKPRTYAALLAMKHQGVENLPL